MSRRGKSKRRRLDRRDRRRRGSFDQRGHRVGTQYNAARDVVINQPPSRHSPTPRQLRAPVGNFVGRDEELDHLVHAVTESIDGGRSAVLTIRGMGGIGKTELAYALAARISDRFPDAQIFLSLRGSTTAPLSAIRALHSILRAFDPASDLPDDVDAAQVNYRSLVNGRRTLVLADDANDAAQVRPLLPPAGSALIITSRSRFHVPGTMVLDLQTLPKVSAERLLTSVCPRIGPFAESLAGLCGYLPLALQVTAHLLQDDDLRNVVVHTEALRDERLRLLRDPMASVDDPQASVEASLRLSYDALSPLAQAALRQLSIFESDFGAEAAHHVISTDGGGGHSESDDRAAAKAALSELRRRSLLEHAETVDRYWLHDLVREFASDRLREQPEEARKAAGVRAAAWYAELSRVFVEESAPFTYDGAASSEQGSRGRRRLNRAKRGEADPGTLAVALTWFDIERENLLGAVRWAHVGEQWQLVCSLATHLSVFLRHRPARREWKEIQVLAIEAADHLNDLHYKAEAIGGLALVLI